MATISQRISLEGSEDIRKQLEQLGVAGEAAFKQIQDAAKKPITDPGQIDKTRQAFDSLAATTNKLGPQFQALADSAKQFGTQGVQATQAVAQGLNQTNAAAAKTGSSFQQIAVGSNLATVGIVALGSALGTVLVGAFDKVRGLVASFSFSELTKGAVETAQELQGQADKIGLSIEQWLQLRKALNDTTMSWDDAVKGLTKLGQVVEQSQAGLARWRETIVQTADGEVTIRKFSGAIADTTTIAGKAAAALRELGVSAGTIASGNKLAIMQEVAVAIDKIPNSADRAERGLRVFGKNWEDIIKSLLASKKALEANRDLLPEQVAQLKKLGDAWDTLGTAVRAVKDQIGLLFAGPATVRAEWLTTFTDGVRKLILQFTQLSEAKRAVFLEGLGTSPAETAFKVLVAVGQQLAGIWRDVLVPAGQALLQIFGGISDSIKGVTNSQVAAFFITAAIAAAGLAIALKGIALVLSPLSALLSLAFSPLGIILIAAAAAAALFWDQLKAGANDALGVIKGALPGFRDAFASLFKGDFSGFWKQFSAAATLAFGEIKKALLESKGIIGDFFRAITGEGVVELPWVKTLVDGITQIGKDLPGTLELIAKGFIALGNAATGVADIINKFFGTELTGTDIAVIAILGTITGGFVALAAVAGIAASALAGFVSALSLAGTGFAALSGTSAVVATGIRTIGTAIGAVVAAFGGWPVVIFAVIAALVILAGLLIGMNWDKMKAGAGTAWDFVKQKAAEAKTAIIDFATSLAGIVWDSIKTTVWNDVIQKAQEAKAAILEFAATLPGVAWDAFKTSALNALNAIINKFKEFIGLKSQASSGDGGGGDGGGGLPFARGGHVGGRGTGTSDSNLAWLSRGEYVIPAHAVRQPGVMALLEALRRSGGNLRGVLDDMGRFARGGMVLPAFAAGGLNRGGSSSASRVLNLTIEGRSFGGLSVPEATAQSLERFAVHSQIASTGRKPSWRR